MPDSAPGLMTLFNEALALSDPAERAAYLDRSCAGDAELRRRVEELLAAHPGIGRFLEPDATAAYVPHPETVAVSGNPNNAQSSAPNTEETSRDFGSVVNGRYTLVEVIGEGGMGSVYLASQTEPVKRQVALKLIKAGMDSKAVLARFDAERQALALMDHPNIARIYDGGVTPTGQPFFVMELVKGVPLTEYCDANRLSVDARLHLFVSVCQAVQHAHQKGIIHRDLKPGNVLVTEVDGRPTPKVIDFGVAKATEQKLTDLSFSDTGAIVGTPAYMSPEQADPTSMDIDTRTDVYALGVMLYELLTGSPPIDSKLFKRGAILEMLRMVREVEPPRPSTKLSTADALPNIAANRNIDPAKLSKLLQGELDWVVMKALEKDRARRYESANAFAQDIQRYLADEVVEARPPSRGYRLKKFVSRNKAQVVAGGLFLVTLVVGVVVSTYFAVLARDEATAARQAEAQAGAEARAARKAEADAKWQERLANDARHAIQIDLALRARAEQDYDRVAALLGEMRPEYQDAWETRYVRNLWRQESPLRATLAGHTGVIRCVAFSPDGKRVVTGSYDFTARVWDAGSGRETALLKGHTAGIEGVAFSPDGKRILTGSYDRTLRLWDAETGQPTTTFTGHTDGVHSVAYSSDGARILTASYDKTVRVWDAATGLETALLKGHTQQVHSMAFSPDGKRVVTGSDDRTARIWDAATGQQTVVLTDKSGIFMVRTVAFSPDGTRVATGLSQGTARVWDAATGQQTAVLTGHTNGVSSVVYSPDGKRLLTGSRDRTARLWDALSGAEIDTFRGHTAPVLRVAFNPDGKRILTGSEDGTARVWDAEMGQELAILKGHRANTYVYDVAFSPDGTRILTGSADSTARIWNAEIKPATFAVKVDLSKLVSPDGRRFLATSFDNTTRVWDTATGQETALLKGKTGQNGLAIIRAFSPNSQRILTGSDDFSAKVWDAATGQQTALLKGHTASVRCVAFSPDGKRILTGSDDNTARIWDAATGRETALLKGHTHSVLRVAFSPDNVHVLTGSYDKTARVWNAETGRETVTLTGHTGYIHSMAFNSDGKRVLTGGADYTARLWDAATGQELALLKGHTGNVNSVAFSPDGKRILTGGDSTARLWDPETSQEKIALKGHTGLVLDVAFSPDGKRVLSSSAVSGDKTAWVWDTETDQEKPSDPLRYREDLKNQMVVQEKRVDTEEQYAKTIMLREKRVSDYPAVPQYRNDLAQSYFELGSLLDRQRKTAVAMEQYSKALGIQEKLVAEFPAVQEFRSGLARTYLDIGTLLSGQSKLAEAQEAYTKALALGEKLALEFPAVAKYRIELAAIYHGLGLVLNRLRKWAVAQEHFNKALVIREKLVVEFPAAPEYRGELAASHFELGGVLLILRKRAEAREQFGKAIALREKLVADFPADPDYRNELGESYCTFGNFLRAGNQPSESLPWFQKAIDILTPIQGPNPRVATPQQSSLRNSFAGRAEAYDQLQKYAEAIADWNLAVELDVYSVARYYRASRATSRLKAGQIAEAVAETAELIKSPNWNASQWYGFACVHAVASGKIADKKQEYADRAMEFLQRALKAGYKDAAHLKKDTDLDVLRGREDFKKLIAELEAKAEKK